MFPAGSGLGLTVNTGSESGHSLYLHGDVHGVVENVVLQQLVQLVVARRRALRERGDDGRVETMVYVDAVLVQRAHVLCAKDSTRHRHNSFTPNAM